MDFFDNAKCAEKVPQRRRGYRKKALETRIQELQGKASRVVDHADMMKPDHDTAMVVKQHKAIENAV